MQRDPESTTGHGRGTWWRRTGVALVTAFLLIALLEVALRLAPERFGIDPVKLEDLRAYLDEGRVGFQPHAYSGFVPRQTWNEKHVVRPQNWSFPQERKPGVPRVACIGGSTTFGEYPAELRKILRERTGGDVEIMNWGVAGWTTMETMVNYFTNVQDYDPDVVVLHHSVNDVVPRLRGGFRSDYAHWRKPWKEPDIGPVDAFLMKRTYLFAALGLRRHGGFRLRNFVEHPFNGVPPSKPAGFIPPGTDHVFRRNVRTIGEHVGLRGGRFVLMTMPYRIEDARTKDGSSLRAWSAGMEEHNQILRDLAAEGGYALVDAATYWDEHREKFEPLFTDRFHMQREGQRAKAELVADVLLAEHLLGAAADEETVPPR